MQRDVQDRRYLVSFLFPLFRVCQHDLPHFQISVWTVEKPKKDGIGGRRFYAAKSMQDDNGRRFYFAWAHDRAENSDRGEWYWGGTFCIPHEVVATADGQLDVKLPEEYVNCFKRES